MCGKIENFFDSPRKTHEFRQLRTEKMTNFFKKDIEKSLLSIYLQNNSAYFRLRAENGKFRPSDAEKINFVVRVRKKRTFR